MKPQIQHQMPNSPFIKKEATSSTNDDAKGLAQEGCAHGSVVWAEMQTAGRGRQGNTWTSLPGNLFMSMVLRPDCPASKAGQLSFVVALALAETLRGLGIKPGIKWPNDILLQDKKAAGILLETETRGGSAVDWVIAGIGVNIASAPDGAICLRDLGIQDMKPEFFLKNLVEQVILYEQLWQREGFTPIRQKWLSYAVRVGQEIRVRLPQRTLTGIFSGIDEVGALQLSLPGGKQQLITSGEVFA